MITLLVGTETGTAEFVADDIVSLLDENNLSSEVQLEFAQDNYDVNTIWLICTSTQGAGEVPNNLKPFLHWLMQQTELSKVRYGVIGLGDSSYDTYCGAAKTLDSLLSDKGAQQLFAPILADAMSDELPEDIIIPQLKPILSKLI